jgi:hypothetical protein
VNFSGWAFDEFGTHAGNLPLEITQRGASEMQELFSVEFFPFPENLQKSSVGSF